MTFTVKVLLTIALILSIAVPFGAFAAGERSRGRHKRALAANVFLFFGTMVFASCLFFTGNAFAAETASAASNATGMGYIAAALSTGLSCIGGGVAVSALEMSQNSERLVWTAEEVDARLHQIMNTIYNNCKDAAARNGLGYNLVAGANIAGFERVADAMLAQGVF